MTKTPMLLAGHVPMTYRCFLDHLPGDVEYVDALGVEQAAQRYAERRWLSWSVRGPDIIVSIQANVTPPEGTYVPIHRFRVACVVRPVAVSCEPVGDVVRMVVARPGQPIETITVGSTMYETDRAVELALGTADGAGAEVLHWGELDVIVPEKNLWQGMWINNLTVQDLHQLLQAGPVVFSRSCTPEEAAETISLTDEDIARIEALIQALPSQPRAEA